MHNIYITLREKVKIGQTTKLSGQNVNCHDIWKKCHTSAFALINLVVNNLILVKPE